MKRKQVLLATIIFLLGLPAAFGQDVEAKSDKDKEKGKESVTVKNTQPSDVPLKIQVLITETDGTRKVSSLPYTIYTIAPPRSHEHSAHLRFGVRVRLRTPVTEGANAQFTYEDVGTNIDCSAQRLEEGQYNLDFTVERTSISMPGANGEESEWKPGNESPTAQPLLRSFKDSFIVVMRDGHTMEGTSAVDPVTGHILKVEVSLNVLN
jgi:hypothetical protein